MKSSVLHQFYITNNNILRKTHFWNAIIPVIKGYIKMTQPDY